ncbi:MAG: redoxin domain-containing protein [Elusimicrobia bacterium]|nr:redoxin domain-containing protein [Elusimicrobiota bacterium]
MTPAAVLAAALLLQAPSASALRPLTPPAPPIPADAAWVNSVPLPLELLRGRRVVLVAFLNMGNLRSRRAAEALKAWWDRYALQGLMVLGVHTPDYEFDRDPLQVRRSVRRQGIPFPVVIDTRRRLWDDYQNEGWPAFYLVDHRGRIVHDKLGEGGYALFEREMLSVLASFNGYKPGRDHRPYAEAKREACGRATPSFYLGSRRGVKTLRLGKDANRPIVDSRDGEVALSGAWEDDAEALRYTGTGKSLDQLYLIFRGGEAGAVLSPGGGRQVRVFIKVDNLWLHGGNAGTDVLWDDSDRSYVLVDEGRLYSIIRDPNKESMHEVSLFPDGPGASVHGFEFSDFCEAQTETK